MFANLNWLGTTNWCKLHWNPSDLMETITPDSPSSLDPRNSSWIRDLACRTGGSSKHRAGRGRTIWERRKAWGRRLVISWSARELFLMNEFKYCLEGFNQKLVQTKPVPAPATNTDGKKTRHNWTPWHPSTVQQPEDKPFGTRNDMFKGRKISREPSIPFGNPCRIWHLQMIEQQVFSTSVKQKV